MSTKRKPSGISRVPVKGMARPQNEGESVDIDTLKPDTHQARRHNPRNIGVIVDSLQRVGAARSVVIDENDMVLAGHGTIQAAKEVGITRVRKVEADGDEIVAVVRRGLTRKQKIRLALSDNRASDLSEFEPETLREFEADDLDGLFDRGEIEEIFGVKDEPTPGDRGDVGKSDERAKLLQKCPNCGHEYVRGS